ncbi:MAG: hypothetical protein DWQ04_13250 [Chloroflexi bacterium]|nr:MAG: hypothetical protein DWQ04_13250 [Chloroflexota bacterium]
MLNYPFKNLAFQGGGIKTLAFQGALLTLEEHGILPQIQRVVGTSAGATVATLVSFRLSAEETNNIFNSVDFAKIPSLMSVKDLPWQPPKLIESQVDRVVAGFDGARRLLNQYGWYKIKYGYQFMQEVIASQCDGNGRATFAEFKARGFRDLHVVGTNLSTKSVEVFCFDMTPDVAVADALLISQSIPLYFESIQFDGEQLGQGDYYGDGGVLNNFPIHVFDREQFAIENEWFINGINWETLGLHLYTPEDCPGLNREITSLSGYISHLMEAMVDQQDVMFENNEVDKWRTINISNCCVAITDFHIKASPFDGTYRKMIAAGRKAASNYLDNYQPPNPDQLKRLKRIMSKYWPL